MEGEQIEGGKIEGKKIKELGGGGGEQRGKKKSGGIEPLTLGLKTLRINHSTTFFQALFVWKF